MSPPSCCGSRMNENGSSREETLTMVRENKEWKVSPGDMMSK